MKLSLYYSLFLIIILSFQCEMDDSSPDIPECLRLKIEHLEKEDCPSVGRVLQYRFQGKTVFVIEPKNCGADFTSEIIDEDCNTLCYLGGIIGNVECEGQIFLDHATKEKQVYP